MKTHLCYSKSFCSNNNYRHRTWNKWSGTTSLRTSSHGKQVWLKAWSIGSLFRFDLPFRQSNVWKYPSNKQSFSFSQFRYGCRFLLLLRSLYCSFCSRSGQSCCFHSHWRWYCQGWCLNLMTFRCSCWWQDWILRKVRKETAFERNVPLIL